MLTWQSTLQTQLDWYPHCATTNFLHLLWPCSLSATIPHCLWLHEVNDLYCLPQAMWSILTHPLSYSAHLCCSVDSQGQDKVQRLAGQLQLLSFHGLPTSCQLILSERNPRSSCVSTFGDSYGKKTLSFWHLELWIALTSSLSHWLACIGYLYWTGWHVAKNVLQLEWNVVISLLKLEAI